MISDIALFGIIEAQRLVEERENWEAVCQGWTKYTPPDTYPLTAEELQELEDIVAEMNKRPATKLLNWCRCGKIYDSRNNEPLCSACARAEAQAWADYQDEMAVARAAIGGR